MPDPRAAKRLLSLGAKIEMDKGEIEVPVEVKDYDDFVQGTMYPKMHKKKVWFVKITLPLELMDNIKEGSIDLADQTIDLDEIEDAYNEDLDKEDTKQTEQQNQSGMPGLGPAPLAGPGPLPPAGGLPPI